MSKTDLFLKRGAERGGEREGGGGRNLRPFKVAPSLIPAHLAVTKFLS